MSKTPTDPLTSNHWGTYRVQTQNGRITGLTGFEADPDPSPIGNGIVDVLDGPTRIKTPMVRQSWLRGGPGHATDLRGDDTFVPVSWETAETLVAAELDRVRSTSGNSAIYGGSYGWGSAGRFHHAQSQLHRFLNGIGGYTRSVNTYSHAAGEVILPHVIGEFATLMHKQTDWQSIIDSGGLLVGFGGVPTRNAQVSAGGTARHRTREALKQARAAGVEFVNISPLRGDMDGDLDAHWLAPRPGSDVAVMLGLAHTLLVENLHDRDFLARYTVGFGPFADYLMGKSDGIEKTAEWAANLSDLPADDIRTLARRMVKTRTMISINWALTRQQYGEQPFWAGTVLAAMIGQIGLPGGGISYGYGAANSVGLETRDVKYRAFPQGKNPVAEFIPVARISDMLLSPGAGFDYNGHTITYPDIKLVYWAGGNPFHHHQDLARLKRAWQKPDTVIVHEWCWNALAKHADIVLPCTTPLERHDLMLTPRDPYIIAMDQVITPVGDARNDFDIFAGISRKMGTEQTFTQGFDAEDWLRWIYDQSRQSASETGVTLPPLEELRATGWHHVEPPKKSRVSLASFRHDPT
ncbi:MAG: biotin/methionine sulfoxide reductase, partial [Paracoccaceae bacterium]